MRRLFWLGCALAGCIAESDPEEAAGADAASSALDAARFSGDLFERNDASPADATEPDAAVADAAPRLEPDAAEPGPDVAPPEPDAGRAPPADVACEGDYVVVEWVVDEAAFDTRYVNPLFAGDIASGELIAWWRIDADSAAFVDGLPDAEGDVVDDPAVPLSAPIAIRWLDTMSFETRAPGAITFHLTAAQYQGAQPIDLTLLQVELSGVFAPDCRSFVGHLRGAFPDRPDFSIPGEPDADLDGDGVPDAWWLDTHFTAAMP